MVQHHHGIEVPETLEDICHPARMALIVYDMQNGIVPQIPDGAEVTARVAEVLDAARTAGVRVVFTRHMSLPTAVMGASAVRMAMAWQRTTDPAGDLGAIGDLGDDAVLHVVDDQRHARGVADVLERLGHLDAVMVLHHWLPSVGRRYCSDGREDPRAGAHRLGAAR